MFRIQLVSFPRFEITWPAVWAKSGITAFLLLLLALVSHVPALCEPPPSAKDRDLAAVVLGPEDEISIHVADFDEISNKPVRIDYSGDIDLPVLGRIRAAGQSVPDLAAVLTERLKTYVKVPRVTVTVVSVRSKPVSVLGTVNKPGIYQLEGPKTLVEVLSLAGGLRPDAGFRVRVTRTCEMGEINLPIARMDLSGKYQTVDLDVDELMSGGNPSLNLMVRAHDVISVAKAELVYVIGEVKKPGAFTINSREKHSLLKTLAMADGPERSAALKSARILRAAADGQERKDIRVNVSEIMNGRAPDVDLQADDILYIPNNTARSIGMRAAEVALGLGTGILIYRH